MTSEINFAAAMAELEEVVRKLESGDAPLEEAVREGDIDADLFAGDFAWGAQAVDEDAVVRGFDESGQILFELREPPRRDLALKHGFLHGGQVLFDRFAHARDPLDAHIVTQYDKHHFTCL